MMLVLSIAFCSVWVCLALCQKLALRSFLVSSLEIYSTDYLRAQNHELRLRDGTRTDVLLLYGCSGTGKSTMLDLMCKELGIVVRQLSEQTLRSHDTNAFVEDNRSGSPGLSLQRSWSSNSADGFDGAVASSSISKVYAPSSHFNEQLHDQVLRCRYPSLNCSVAPSSASVASSMAEKQKSENQLKRERKRMRNHLHVPIPEQKRKGNVKDGDGDGDGDLELELELYPQEEVSSDDNGLDNASGVSDSTSSRYMQVLVLEDAQPLPVEGLANPSSSSSSSSRSRSGGGQLTSTLWSFIFALQDNDPPTPVVLVVSHSDYNEKGDESALLQRFIPAEYTARVNFTAVHVPPVTINGIIKVLSRLNTSQAIGGEHDTIHLSTKIARRKRGSVRSGGGLRPEHVQSMIERIAAGCGGDIRHAVLQFQLWAMSQVAGADEQIGSEWNKAVKSEESLSLGSHVVADSSELSTLRDDSSYHAPLLSVGKLLHMKLGEAEAERMNVLNKVCR